MRAAASRPQTGAHAPVSMRSTAAAARMPTSAVLQPRGVKNKSPGRRKKTSFSTNFHVPAFVEDVHYHINAYQKPRE